MKNRHFVQFLLLGLVLLLTAALPLSAQDAPKVQEKAPATAAPPASASAPEVKPITFVAYNLKNYLRMDRKVDGEFKKAAPKPAKEVQVMMAILKTIQPDILGVCEIGKKESLADFLKALKEQAGLEYPHVEWSGGVDETRYLALLSKFPIVQRNSKKTLPYKIGDAELSMQRGVLHAVVAVHPEYHLDCIGIHLKSKREVDYADQALIRRNEAALLRKHIDSILIANPDANVLAYGDFNDTKNEKPIRVIKGRFPSPLYLTDIRLKDSDGYYWTYHWGYADIYSRFDFVFSSKGLLPEIDRDKSYIHKSPDWYTASDHRPLVVYITPEDKKKK